MTDEATKRAALVTGGAQGIGKATALRLLRDGMSVLIADGGMTKRMIYVE